MTEHWRYIYSLDCFAKRLSELLKEAEDNGLSESEIAPVPSFQSFAESDSRIVLCEPPGFNKALTVGDQLLEQALRVNFVTSTCADQIHRNIGVDQNHLPAPVPYPASISVSMPSMSPTAERLHF